MNIEEDKKLLEEVLDATLPDAWLREDTGTVTNNIFKSKTLANLDSLGQGPEGIVRLSGRVVYTKRPFIVWAVSRVRQREVVHIRSHNRR